MKCSEYEILINDYIDDELTPVKKLEMEEHLRSCKDCNKVLAESMELIEKASSLPVNIAPDVDLWKNIEARIAPGHDTNKVYSFDTKRLASESIKEKRTNLFYRYAVITTIAAVLLITILPALLKHKEDIKNIKNEIGPSWKVTNTMGITLVASNILQSTGFIKEGEELETKDSSGAVVDVDGLGTITLEPNTKIKFIKDDSTQKRISVIYGSIHANINSKPRTFFVDTRSATAIDMGCAYNMNVDTSGDAILFVQKGTVILSSKNRESIVPEGKYCMSKTGIGPGTPYRENVSKELKDALLSYDFGNGGEKSVSEIIKNAKKTDAVTLINILPRIEGASKSMVYEKLNKIAPPPAGRNFTKIDSIPDFDVDDLCEWAQKLQSTINKEIQEKMKIIQKEIQENLHNEIKIELGDMNSPEFQEKLEENIEKNLDNFDRYNDYLGDTAYKYFDSEKFNNQMEKLNEELEKNNEKIQEDMEKFQERMEKFNEEMQKKQGEINDKIQEKQQKMLEKELNRQQEQRERELDKQQEQRERELDKQQEQRERELDKQQEQRDQEQEQKDNQQPKQDDKQQHDNDMKDKDQNMKLRFDNYNKTARYMYDDNKTNG